MVGFKERAEAIRIADQKAWNQRWGELANRLGTIAEDIVAPNLPRIARDYFGVSTILDFTTRRKVRNRHDPARQREFDAIAVGEEKVLISETKATPRIEYVKQFRQALAELDDYLPEYTGKIIIPIFASLSLGNEVLAYLTRHGIYGMAMGDETMELLNYEEIQAGADGEQDDKDD